MQMDWLEVNAIVDEVAIALGVLLLIVRQFLWRSADRHRMLRLPLALLAIASVMTAVESIHTRWVTADWLLVGELILVGATGVVMGRVTRFRLAQGGLYYRLRSSGVLLWFAFLGIRLGVFALAAQLGADVLDASGLVLLSFAVNRLAAGLVVRRRALQLDSETTSNVSSPVSVTR